MKISNFLSIIFFFLFSINTEAQLIMTLNVDPNPTPKILDWAANPNTVMLNVTNPSIDRVDYKIKASIKRNGSVVARTNLNQLPTESIGIGDAILHFVEDIIPANAVDILDNAIAQTYSQSGKVPGGIYMLCVELVDPINSNLVLSMEQCRPMTITDYQIPRLLSPSNRSKINLTQLINFSWSPVVPPLSSVSYKFRIVELLEGETDLYSAFLRNAPLEEKDILGMTNLLYTNEFAPLSEKKSYAWGIQASDMDGDVIGADNGYNGWAGINEFSIINNSEDEGGSENEDADEAEEMADCSCNFSNKRILPKAKTTNTTNPLEYSIHYISFLEEYKKCFKGENYTNHAQKIVVDWGDGKTSTNNYTGGIVIDGRFMHRYASPDDVPNQICIDYSFKVNEKTKIEGQATKREKKYCKYQFCIPFSAVEIESCKENTIDFTYETDNLNISLENESTIDVKWQDQSNFKWEFGDGKSSPNMDQEQYSYNENGEYEVCLVYAFDNNGTKEECRKCKNIKIESECDAKPNFSKFLSDKSSGTYTFISKAEAINGAKMDSIKWFIDDEYMGSKDTLERSFTKTTRHEICHTVYVTNSDNTNCEITKCREVKFKGCSFEECNFNCDNLSTKSYANGDTITLCGGFEMVLVGDPSGSSSNLSGKGKVYFSWLLTDVAVEFSNIKINDQDQLCQGEIWGEVHDEAPTYPQQWGINMAMGFSWTEPLIRDLETWVYNTVGNKVDIYSQAQAQVKPVKVPLGVNNAEGITLAITAFKFAPDRNNFSAVAAYDFDTEDDHILGFEATNITYTNAGPVNPFANGGSGGFEIIAPKTIYYTTNNNTDDPDWFAIKFNKRGSGNLGTGVNWTHTCGGKLDWCFRLDADFEMPRKWLTPIPDNGNKVSTNIQTELCNWEDWIVMLSLPKSSVTDINGLELTVNELTFDKSSLRNAYQMKFPANYTGDKTDQFTGFWLKNAKLTFPKKFTTFSDTTRRVEVNFNDWIINKRDGITGELLAKNVINFPDGNIADLGASIDTIKINMVNNSLTTAYMSGKLIIPITDEDPMNSFSYKGLFGTGKKGSFDGFTFNVKPDNDITSEFFADGELTIFNTSSLDLVLTEKETSFSILLNGNIDLPGRIENTTIGDLTGLGFNTPFEGLLIQYKNGKMKFDHGKWSLNSPQKQFFKFPVTLEEFKPLIKTPDSGELWAGGFSVDAVINLDKERIGGRTTLEMIGAFVKPAGQRIKPIFKRASLSEVNIYAHLPAIKMDGTINFISDDPIWGDGLKGDISAQFNSLKTAVSVGAFFGNTSYNSSSRYRYWKAEAKVVLPPPGLVFLPGLAFRGFGASAYRHMEADYSTVDINTSNLGSAQSSTSSGATFLPNPNIAFGFRVEGVLASTPKEESFNADVGISGEFTNSGGMTFLRFDGDFYVGAGFNKRNDAIVKGTVAAQYDFPTKEFFMGAAVNINRPPITTPNDIGLSFYINGKSNKWYFKVGEPNNPNTINVFGLSTYSYLMFGNDIYAPPTFMQRTIDGYAAATKGGQLGSINGADVDNADTRSGKGLAFGTGFTSGDSGSKHLIGRLSANYSYSIGGELNLSLMEYSPGCITGLNGWYAKGGVALYGGFNLGFHARAKGIIGGCGDACALYCCKKYPSGKYFHIGSAGFGVWANGAFPNPTYLQGGLDLTYNIIGLSGTYRANFKVGNSCNQSPIANPVNFQQEDAAANNRLELIKHIEPAGYEISASTSLKAQYGFVPNQAFDVAEQQADGTIVYRTFQARYTPNLSKIIEGVSTNVPIYNEGINMMGQYEYINNLSSVSSNVSNSNNLQLTTGSPLNVGGNNTASNNKLNGNVANEGNLELPNNLSSEPYGGQTNYSSLEGSSQGEILNTPYQSSSNSQSNQNDSGHGYGDLPPPPSPIINNLEKNTDYKFEVVSILYEFDGTRWIIAKDKNNQVVTQSKSVNFRTGKMTMSQANAGNMQATGMN